MRMRFGIYVKAAGTAAIRIATVPVALFINRISCGSGMRDSCSGLSGLECGGLTFPSVIAFAISSLAPVNRVTLLF